MKKSLFALLCALILIFTAGCSCTQAAVLSFDNLWKGESVGYKESLLYTVNFTDDYTEYGYSYKKAAEISSFNCDYNGTFETETEILSAVSSEIPDVVKSCGVFDAQIDSVLKLTSRLDLTAEYSYGDKSQTSTDHIYVTAYLYNSSNSFAPIYTERDFFYTYPTVTSGGFELTEVSGKDFTYYGKETYKIVKEKGDAKTEKDYQYAFRTLIDNSALLLAARNKNIVSGTPASVPVVAAAYGSAQKLRLSNFTTGTQKITAQIDGVEKEREFAVKGISFVSSNVNSSGTAQLLYIQNGKYEDIDKSLIISYVEPLVEYGAHKRTGALIYTLKTATFS